MKVFMWPHFAGEDNGDGGIRRVIEGQTRSLPRLRVKFVDQPSDADVIACHVQIPGEYLRRFPDKPIVVHNHGLYWSDFEWQEWAYKANREGLKAICTASAVTAPTEWVADILRRHTSRPVTAIPHGINVKEWQPPVDGHKGYALWNKTRIDPVCEIDSLNALTRVAPEFEFVSTFGDERKNVYLTDKLPFERAKDLVRHAETMLCTTRETFGVGTLEAMACGVPIVGFDFGGQSEILTHEVDSYLVPPGDILGLKAGLAYVRENRERMSEAARETAKNYTWERAARMYQTVYLDAIERFAKEQERPRVTIVVPAFKLEKYLPDTLDSIVAQEDQNWECIVVDDASPDSCGEIAETYAAKDERIRVIHNETNQYLAEARNIAIREARGKYILPVDADDMLPPTAVGLLADALDEDLTLQSAYGGVFFTEEDGKTPSIYPEGPSPGHSQWPIQSDPWRQVNGHNLQPYSSMFRRSAWESVGGYRRRLKTAEDADFWTRLASYGFRASMVTKADTLIYRNRPGSMSRANDHLRTQYLRWYPWIKKPELAPAGLTGETGIALKTPHVSVIIPVGPGHEKLVQDAVDSVAAQSYPYWECIVVNDSGSKLELPTWVKEVHSDKRDTGGARNDGLKTALGSVFLPLDADDYLQPDALSWLVEAFAERKGNCIIYPDMYEDPHEAGVYTVYQFPDWNCENLRARMIYSVTALTPVQVWKDVGGYTENMVWEDWDFQLKAAKIGICSYRIATPLFTYRKWTGQRRHYKDEAELQERLDAFNLIWGDYRTGKEHFMACGCSGQTIQPPVSAPRAPVNPYGAEAVLVEYTGGKSGATRFRGAEGVFYSFAAGMPPSYVAARDVPIFERRPDFRVLVGVTDSHVAEVAGPEPVLSA